MTPLQRLGGSFAKGRSTQLGIGPMSIKCVDAVIDAANELQTPIMLIASRRQIECADYGGGYVNGWTTESFANYVRLRDKGRYVLLCRDHGGPWQNYMEVERRMSGTEAMVSARHSFARDIASDFDILHLDPSIPPAGAADAGSVLDMLFDLYHFVQENARDAGREIAIEVGTEEQNGGLDNPEELESFLNSLSQFCRSNDYQMPLFVVAQTGTLVRETSNIGHFVSGLDDQGLEEAVTRVNMLVEAANNFGVLVKEHNGDYLPDHILSLRPKMGIGAINIAPELGVAETRFLLELCRSLGLARQADDFIQLSFDSGKWEKWLMPNTSATDYDKGVIAGHYVFSSPEFAGIYADIEAACSRQGIDLQQAIRDHLKSVLSRLASRLNII
ncbi:MAG: tagatose-6-phosphate kinase [Acidobacteriota bacterium]|nr:MAG: tagatose-6-phosphate kinase [Acidobacteriota bacterium]